MDYAAKQVVVVDSTGTITAKLGKAGGGPGELLFPGGLVAMPGDRVGVLDSYKMAIVAFQADGSASQLRLDSLLPGPLRRVTAVSLTSDGHWYFSAVRSVGGATREGLYERHNGSERLVAETPAASHAPVVLPCGIVLAEESPVFWPSLRWAASDSTIYVASDDRYRVLVMRGGSGVDTVTREVTPTPATFDLTVGFPIGASVRAGEQECIISAEDAARQRGLAPFVSPISAITVSPTGTLWVRRFGPDTARAEIDVFERDGTFRRTIAGIPFPVAFLTRSHFAALEYNADGVASLVLWRVGR
ncbi:MAG: hypothetical protein Q8K82_06685 [Gemmatimonadaceae bacterium]|nr:hypothetical protein [Gemmatimonadaceae bacterium]